MKTKKIEARVLKGFHDKLPHEALAREQVISKLKEVFLSFGFAPIETPHLEYAEVLSPSEGDEVAKQLYRFKDQGDRDVMLRYDLTVPFSRFVVQHKNQLGIPFKRFAIGSVFRGEAPQLGRYREFTQCDFDIVGTRSVSADAEVALVLAQCYQALDLPQSVIRFNNRRVMNGLCELLGVEEKYSAILRVIDKLDKIGVKAVREELIGIGLTATVADDFLGLLQASELTNEKLLANLSKRSGQSGDFDLGLKELTDLYTILEGSKVDMHRFRIDLTLARGLAYYTGTIFEAVLTTHPELGSIGGGGRYDNLTKSFSDDELPGVGASVGLDRVITAYEMLGRLEKKATPADLLCAQVDQQLTPYIFEIATQLRANGVRVEVYPEATKLKKQLQYADRLGHKFILIVGSEERSREVMALKNMAAGTQEEVKSVNEIVAKVSSTISQGLIK